MSGRARLRPRGLHATCAGSLVAALAFAGACDDHEVHIFAAQLFEAPAQCIQPSPTALDVIGGAGAPGCAAACLVESGQVYVSTVCPPYPPGYAVEMRDASLDASDPCAAALRAYEAGIACEGGDGGSD